MYKIINNKLIELGSAYKHLSISNYHLMPNDKLKADGWKDLIDIKPSYDKNTQYLSIGGYTEDENSIFIEYNICEIEAPEITLDDKVEEIIAALQANGINVE